MVRPLLSTLDLAHIPPELKVHVALYQDLKNSRYLRKQLIEQNEDFEYAFIDARKVLSTTHLLAAVFRAVNDQANGRLKSHNVHSEIVVSLNATNNIGDALRKFGISDQTRNLIVVKVASSQAAEGIAAQLEQAVEGEPLEFTNDELAKHHDIAEIRKTYKVGPTSTAKGKGTAATVPPSSDARSEQASGRDLMDLEMAILGSMALRGAT